MSKLSVLSESIRDARAELDRITAEYQAILESRKLTKDEMKRLADVSKRIDALTLAYAEARADESRAAAEQGKKNKLVGAAGSVRLGKEPLTFSPDNPHNSFVRSLFAAAHPGMRGHDAARQLLVRHQEEMDGLVRSNPRSPEGRAIERYARTAARSPGERRDVSTGTASMGDFAPPLYFLPEYAAYRTYGRTLIDALKKMPMPETGMVFNVPKITTPTEGVNQTTSTQGAGENTTVSSRTLTSTYKTGAVQTIVNNLLVSQQYLDRIGPGIGGDEIVRDDQARQMNRALNVYGWKALLKATTVGTVTYTESAFGGQTFRAAIYKAKAAIERTDSVVAYPTHIFTDVTVWATLAASFDANDRPFVVPDGVAFNPIASGNDTATPEGATGYKLADLPVFKDQALNVAYTAAHATTTPVPTTHPTLVGALDIAVFWMESTPVLRVLPQPYAKQLTVLIQSYVYCAAVPVYPEALQFVQGTGTETAHLTA